MVLKSLVQGHYTMKIYHVKDRMVSKLVTNSLESLELASRATPPTWSSGASYHGATLSISGKFVTTHLARAIREASYLDSWFSLSSPMLNVWQQQSLNL